MNQAQLGQHLGLSQASISDRLLGKSPFTVDELEQLAELFGITLAELLQPSTSWYPTTEPVTATAYDLAA